MVSMLLVELAARASGLLRILRLRVGAWALIRVTVLGTLLSQTRGRMSGVDVGVCRVGAQRMQRCIVLRISVHTQHRGLGPVAVLLYHVLS